MLSDKQKKQIYDTYGEEGLKGGMPPDSGAAGGAGPGGGFPGGGGAGGFPGGFAFPGGGSGGGTTFTFSSNGPGGGSFGGFRPSDPNDIFSRLFSGGGGGGGASMFGDMDDVHMGGMPGGFFQQSGRSRQQQPRTRVSGEEEERPVITRPLPVSLEDLYGGATKRLKITRKLRDAASGRQVPTEKILEVKVKPGWKAGTKIKFPGEGDELPNGQGVQDFQFVVSEKPHTLFTREGDDLKCTVTLSLLEALAGYAKSVTTIDGKKLPVEGTGGNVQPGQVLRFPNQGMPLQKTPSQRGDLLVAIKVELPSLTSTQKRQIKDILKT